MTIAQHPSLPQGTRTDRKFSKYRVVDKSTGEVEHFLLQNQYVGSDPLTGRAYFDTVNLTPHLTAINAHQERAMKNRNLDYVRVSIHADLIAAKAVEAVAGLSPASNGGGGIRGEIVGFSRASRKRMIEFLAKARIRGQLLFATFTYADEFPVGQPDVWLAHFEALRRRIERKYPTYSIVWRKELKERKSGDNVGKLAPHYHMIVDTGIEGTPAIKLEKVVSYGKLHDKCVSPASQELETWALQAWNEIVFADDSKLFGSSVIASEDQAKHSQYGCFVVACRNRRHAYKYVSKYVAKEEHDNFAVGRRWGRIGKWDTAPSHDVVLTKQEVIELKRLLRRWMKSRSRSYGKFMAKQPVANGWTVMGLGDTAQSGDTWRLLINHASELAGMLPPFLDINSNSV